MVEKLPYDFYYKVEDSNYVKHILYGDSVTGDSIVIIRRIIEKYEFIDVARIEDLFNYLPGKIEIDLSTGKQRKFLLDNNIWILGYDVEKRKNCFVKPMYIMRHEVNKDIYRIETIDGRYVDVTEDHSVMIVEDDDIVQCRPCDINVEKHKLLVLQNYTVPITTKIKSIKNIGKIDDYVYDIAFDKIHTFYANEILVHNTDSLFIQLLTKEELEKLGYELRGDKESIDNVSKHLVEPISKKINEELVKLWNNTILNKMHVDSEWNTIDFKTELIMDKILFTGKKKRYACRIYKEDKVYYIPPKIKISGIEIKRSDSSRLTKYAMSEIIRIIFDYSGKERLNKTKELIKEITSRYKKATNELDFEEIGIPSSWSLSEYKEIPTYVFAAMLYNSIIRDTCRPGVKGFRISCMFNTNKILELLKKVKNPNEYQMDVEMFNKVKNKLNVFFIPPDYDRGKIKELVNKGVIKFDWDEQYNKIIREKLQQFVDLIKGR